MTAPAAPLSNNPLSRVAAKITALGALLTLLAFVGTLWQLHTLETQLKAKRTELEGTARQLLLLKTQASSLSSQVQSLKSEVQRFRQFNQKFDAAIRPQTDRDYATSAERLLPIVREYPNNEVALYWLARAYSKINKYVPAVDCASKAIAIDPLYIDPYEVLVFSLHFSGRQQEAVQQLQHALNINIEAYPYFWAQTRDLEDLWRIQVYRNVFLAHERKIRAIQQALSVRGLYKGKTDGLVGSLTRAAVDQFCQSQGITNSIPVDLLLQRVQ